VAVIRGAAEPRIRRIHEAAQSLVGGGAPLGRDAAQGEPLVSPMRAPALIEAVEDALTVNAPRAIEFTLIRARAERTLRAQIRALDPAGPRDPAALILIEDQTRMRQIEEMRQDFIANASHELKTPLASIMGFIETLQGPARADEAARTRFLGIMATQAERMKRLVEDLMSLSRIEMNQHVRPTGAVDLGALAHATAAAMEPVAADKGARIEVLTEAKGPVTTGDHDQLAQLLTNLIDNAVKYGGEGVTITIRAAEPAPEWPGMVGITVADDGPGIPREHLPRLTERFYRVSAARSRAVGGTGLGLAIAKHILQRHRGQLSLRSTLGEGSAFTIWLPPRNDSPAA
ncbi:MAG: sensor histidine kinase, partial [Pikeienuella sp.]